MNDPQNPSDLDAWLSLLERRHPKAIDLGLDRCRAVWDAMGRPQPAPRSFVVAGTNGKGSTVATLCSLLGALGHRYGSYTTPHLLRYNERVQVGECAVADADLLSAFERVEAARGEVSLTYFEFGTLAAFDLLARAGLDFAVMEVGLGGRLDAVNLLDADCAVITPIGLDHQEYLGPDRESIGREKAGVMRPGRPVIVGDRQPPASLLSEAAARGARLLRLGVDFEIETVPGGVRFELGGDRLELPPPALPGAHQVDNLAVGLAALLQLLPGAADRVGDLAAGVKAVRLAGRFELAHTTPRVWLDVGHNPMAAEIVAAALEQARSAGLARRFRCVLGMLADKDAAAAAEALAGPVCAWYCGGLPGERGQGGEQLARRIGPVAGESPVRPHGTVSEALQAALQDAAPGDGILVFGSFLTVAEARRFLDGAVSGADPAAG